jgi:hypothetical protein
MKLLLRRALSAALLIRHVLSSHEIITKQIFIVYCELNRLNN